MRSERRSQLAYEVQRLWRSGRSQRQIAHALGIARRTVRRLLEGLERRRQQGESAVSREVRPRLPKPSKLDAFEGAIRNWLERDSKLTAVRCLEKLHDEEGFEGAYTIVRERLRELRHEIAPPGPTATPIETAPGQRGEFDWSPYTLASGDGVQLFHAVLRWSRAPSLAAATDTRQTTTLRLLRATFEEWGGVPTEMLTDSMPGVVDRWERDEPILNARYVDFVAHYRYTALIAPRGHAQAKAVAERRFRFHEENLLNGRKVHSFEHYEELLEWWKREKVLARPHPETRRPIAEMLELERAHLAPLPARPYDTRDVVVRLVDDYRRVRLDTNHYPAPAPVGSRVYVCADTERVEICDHRGKRLIEHERLPAGARIKLPPSHAGRARYDLDELEERVGLWGETAAAFAAAVRKARRTPGRDLVRLLGLAQNWSADDIVAAMAHALDYRCYEVGKLERILEARFTPRRFEEQIAESTRARIHEVMKAHPVSARPLASYDALETGDPSAAAASGPVERDGQEDEEGHGERS